MARFINHCCEPNAYARVISLNLKAATAADDFLEDKHIIIMAARDIQVRYQLSASLSNMSVGMVWSCLRLSAFLTPVFNFNSYFYFLGRRRDHVRLQVSD